MTKNIAAATYGSDTDTVQRKQILARRAAVKKDDLIDLLRLIADELEAMDGDLIIYDLTIDRDNGYAAVYYFPPTKPVNP